MKDFVKIFFGTHILAIIWIFFVNFLPNIFFTSEDVPAFTIMIAQLYAAIFGIILIVTTTLGIYFFKNSQQKIPIWQRI